MSTTIGTMYGRMMPLDCTIQRRYNVVVVINSLKTNGQLDSVRKPSPLAVCRYGDGSSVVERGICNPFNESSNPSHRPMLKALIGVRALTRAEISTAEAIQTSQIQYCASGCESQGDSSYDVSDLPNRM